jgi:hypothetical protein
VTISSTTNRVSYQGNGTTAALAISYPFLATTDLVVIETIILTGAQTTKALTTDYTVTGTPDATGAYPNGGSVVPVAAIAATLKWTIYRDPPATQTQAVVDNDPLPASVFNSGLDKLTMLVQRVRDLVTRGARLSDGDVSGASVTLPMPVASSLLGWASDGLSIVNYVVANLTGSIVTAFSSTLLAAADAASWRSALGLGTFADTTAANTFTADQTITSTDAGATAGPTLTLKRNSASPAVNDIIGQVDFQSKDSGGGTDSAVRLRGVIVDPTAASEDAELHIQTEVAGTVADRVVIGQGVQVGSPTGGDKGAGTVNATAVYVNGGAIPGTLTAGTSCVKSPLVASSVTVQAHGLGAKPAKVELYLECLTAEFGYSIGDQITLESTNTGTPYVVAARDVTNVTLIMHANIASFSTLNKGTAALVTLTAANWKAVAVPYKVN